jgi:hypothetical protein
MPVAKRSTMPPNWIIRVRIIRSRRVGTVAHDRRCQRRGRAACRKRLQRRGFLRGLGGRLRNRSRRAGGYRGDAV